MRQVFILHSKHTSLWGSDEQRNEQPRQQPDAQFCHAEELPLQRLRVRVPSGSREGEEGAVNPCHIVLTFSSRFLACLYLNGMNQELNEYCAHLRLRTRGLIKARHSKTLI